MTNELSLHQIADLNVCAEELLRALVAAKSNDPVAIARASTVLAKFMTLLGYEL